MPFLLSNTGMLTGQQLGSRIRDYDSGEGADRSVGEGGRQPEEVDRSRNGGAETGRSRVCQLPPVLADFAGRDFELQEMFAAQTNPATRVIGLQGTGGVGKTSLAVRFAHQLAESYPDSLIYIDLKGGGSQPLPVADAQAQIIRSFMPEVRLPEHEVELTRLYQSVLSGKRALLLLDNAASVPQVVALLPPEGWLTVVTTRQSLSVNGMFTRHLQVLSPTEATEMLQRLVPRMSSTDAGRIAELCGNLPLALRVVAGTMRQQPGLQVSDFAVRLTTRQLRGPFIEGVLQSCYELLSPGLQQLWRFLAPFQASFDLQAAAAVWRISPQMALETLRQFDSFSLLEVNAQTGRYRIHDLMLQFIDQRLTGEERRIAKHRFSSHYQSVLHEADALYEQGGKWLKQGIDLLDLEWQNIQNAQIWARRHVDDDRAACELCNSFPDAGKYVLSLRQHPRERIRWNEAALEASRSLNRRKSTARHLIALGDSYIDLGEINHAIDCYEQALSLTSSIRDRRGEADARSGLGQAHYLAGGLDAARRFHGEALDLAYQIGDHRVEAVALGNLGVTHFGQGEVRTSCSLFEQQLKLAREMGDRRNESVALGGIGMTWLALGEPESAISSLSGQLRIAREIGDRRGQCSALTNLGNGYVILKEYGRALEILEEALAIAHDLADRRAEANAHGGLGIAYFHQGDLVIARQYFERQVNLSKMIGDRRGEGLAQINLSEIASKVLDYGLAVELAQQAILISSGLGDKLGLGNAHMRLAIAYAGQGERRKALSHAERARQFLIHTQLPVLAEVDRKIAEWGMG
ncbi:MAG: ATP-binding protein [Blastocatellia bacterium]|jgi:tetratricopeptide (TPR) repeat protein